MELDSVADHSALEASRIRQRITNCDMNLPVRRCVAELEVGGRDLRASGWAVTVL
jgi:hypothetical protein